jgi:hypothetical protein
MLIQTKPLLHPPRSDQTPLPRFHTRASNHEQRTRSPSLHTSFPASRKSPQKSRTQRTHLSKYILSVNEQVLQLGEVLKVQRSVLVTVKW